MHTDSPRSDRPAAGRAVTPRLIMPEALRTDMALCGDFMCALGVASRW